jgi:hypothetical protein
MISLADLTLARDQVRLGDEIDQADRLSIPEVLVGKSQPHIRFIRKFALLKLLLKLGTGQRPGLGSVIAGDDHARTGASSSVVSNS